MGVYRIMLTVLLRLISITHTFHLHNIRHEHHIRQEKFLDIGCDTRIEPNDEMFQVTYRVRANQTNDGRPCYLPIPSHVFIAMQANFESEKSYVRLVAGHSRRYSMTFPKIFKNNATVPYKTHRNDKSHVWFVPCNKAAILYNTNRAEDFVSFKFMKMDQRVYEKYEDPECCNTYLIILGK